MSTACRALPPGIGFSAPASEKTDQHASPRKLFMIGLMVQLDNSELLESSRVLFSNFVWDSGLLGLIHVLISHF